MSTKSLRVETPPGGYRRLMTFNRYFVERIDCFVLMHFALVSPSGSLLDAYSCSISKMELESQKKSLMAYLGQAGALSDPPPQWQPPVSTRAIDVINHIGLCGNSEIGEITLNNIVGRVLAEAKASQVIKVDPIALLRSSMSVHKHWIKDIYS